MEHADLERAYEKTALFRMGVPFADVMHLDAVRIPLEGSVRRAKPQNTTQPAKAAAGAR